MELNGTFYPNVNRTIIGSGNLVFTNDVILNCDTTLNPVDLTLAEIPSGSWSTQYRLYIIDKSGNASVNNITINAPVGYTINDLPSLVININNGSAVITITKDKGYLATLSSGGGGGSALETLNQGVSVTTTTQKINFVGIQAILTAPNEVEIKNAFISGNVTTILALAGSNSLIANQWYNLTDVFYGLFGNIYNVYVPALSSSNLSKFGIAEFYNADYEKVGDYSGISGFNAQLGIWQPSLVPVQNDVVIWNNLHYVNLTGVNTPTNPSIDPVNWKALAFNTKNGYILEYNEITLNTKFNTIIYRKDQYNNEVEDFNDGTTHSFNQFPFGNQKFVGNKVQSQGLWYCCNYIVGLTAINNTITSGVVSTDTNLPFIVNVFDSNEISTNRPIKIYQGSLFLRFVQNKIFTCQGDLKLEDCAVTLNEFSCCTFTISLSGGTSMTRNFGFATTFFLNKSHDAMQDNTFFNSSYDVDTSGREQNNFIENSNVKIDQNKGFFRNNKISQNSVLEIVLIDTAGVFEYNTLNNKTNFKILTTLNANLGDGGSKGLGNTFSNCLIEINQYLVAGFFSNQLEDVVMKIDRWDGSMVGCHIYNQSLIELSAFGGKNLVGLTCQEIILGNSTFVLPQTYISGTHIFGVNTIQGTLDCADPTIYDAGTFTLTIPITLNKFLGKIQLLNANGLTIKNIQNLFGLLPYSFSNDAGTTTFVTTPVGVGFSGDLISNQPAPFSIPIVYRVDGGDYINVLKSTFMVGITDYFIFA